MLYKIFYNEIEESKYRHLKNVDLSNNILLLDCECLCKLMFLKILTKKKKIEQKFISLIKYDNERLYFQYLYVCSIHFFMFKFSATHLLYFTFKV